MSADKVADLWRASGLDVKAFFAMPEDAEEMTTTYSWLSS